MELAPKSIADKFGNMLRSGRYGLRALSLLDQLLFSIANFILMLTLARYYSSAEVAGYGIGLSIALIIQGTQRNLYVVQNSVLSPDIFRRRTPKIVGQHLIIWGFVIAVELLVASFLLLLHFDAYHLAILYATIVCSLIYAQLDFDRICLLKHKKYRAPLEASAVFLFLNLMVFFAASRSYIGFSTVMLLVGGYAVLKILRLVMLMGRPDFFWGWRLVKRDGRKYLASSVLGVVGSTGFSHVPLFVLSVVSPPLHAAAFVALRGLMQPLGIVIRSLDIIDKNLSLSKGVQTSLLLKRVFWKQFTLYGVVAAGAVIGTAVLGPFVLSLFYGDRYLDFYGVLLGWAGVFSAITITFPLETIIVKRNRLVQYNLWRLLAGAVGVVLAFYLCPLYGAVGAILACLGGWVFSVLFAIWIVRDVLFAR